LIKENIMNDKNPCPYCGAPEVFDDDEVPMKCPSCDETIGESRGENN
jgi:hypothetical protein